MSIKDRLKLLLEKLGLSIKEFSNITGIPYRTLQNYLLGLREPSAENLSKICSQLGVNLNWLLTGEGEIFIKKKIVNIKDIHLENIKAWLDEFWENASDEEKTWLKIQFEKAFPEYKEWLFKKKNKSS